MEYSHFSICNVSFLIIILAINQGLDPRIIESILVTKVADAKKLPNDKKDCIICLMDFETNEEIITLPCAHIYHSQCIKDWFLRDKTCPCCKFVVTNESLGM